ncbi:protamine-like [Frankliniella occidentalis]|uniref:Protamine-like n=1 Tax=Frankliniella occidentalis TaxID=133901 RepID=A0A9C6X8F7_FRAOC|nr:protamine-like [Frankliniella occidentalis]
MTVIRAPSDDDNEKEAVQTDADSGVAKAVGKSIKYIRSVLGLKKTRRRRRKSLRPPSGFKASRNPFFNFLRHLQAELDGMSAAEVAREGGRRWRLMSDREKEPYRRLARRAPRSKGGDVMTVSSRVASRRGGGSRAARGRSRSRSRGARAGRSHSSRGGRRSASRRRSRRG